MAASTVVRWCQALLECDFLSPDDATMALKARTAYDRFSRQQRHDVMADDRAYIVI
jgi:hypothetical protein